MPPWFGDTFSSRRHCKKRRKLNRLAAVTITPTKKSTPTRGLEVIYDLMPLELFIQQTALASKHRLGKLNSYSWREENKTGTIKGHMKHWQDIEEEYNITATTSDSCRELLR